MQRASRRSVRTAPASCCQGTASDASGAKNHALPSPDQTNPSADGAARVRRLVSSRLAALTRLVASARAALAGRLGEGFQHRFGLRPADAGIRNGHAVTQRLSGLQILTAFFQMTFKHHADNAALLR